MFRETKWFVTVLLVVGICASAIQARLIGYWPFEEGQGTETADITGNGNDGTFNGEVEWVPGYLGNGVRFDTGGERIVIGPLDPTAENNAMTLATWINWEGQGHTQEQQGIIGKRLGWDPGDGVKWFWQTNPAGDLLFRADNTAGGDSLGWGNALLVDYANEWVHVALTWDDGATLQYINAEELSTGDVGFRDTADDTPMTIGCVQSDWNETFVGTMDEVRIYDTVLTPPEIQTIMLGEFPTASNPVPADGAFHEDTWLTLSWRPGTLAGSHDVYLGEDYDVVNDAMPDSDVYRGNQVTEFYIAGFPGFAYPEGLIPGTTYYWRIDEVNEAHADSPWKGEVWSFTIPPKTAYNPDPADGTELTSLVATLSWTPGFGAKLHTVYFGDDFDAVANATVGAPVGVTRYNPGPLEQEKVYYWRVDEFDGIGTYKGDVWTFTTQGAVGNPQPANGATDVGMAATLSWTAADNAASHQVYFGLDKDTVRSADTGSPEYKGPKALGDESYDPGLLELGATYCWRVDEVYNGNPVRGPVWSFTVGDYLLVDDFESYTDDDVAGQAIWQHWIDGFGVADNGAQVGYLVPPYCEQTIVHGGSQSMPLLYVNEAGVTNSEALLTLTAPRDWTMGGVEELSLWSRGDSANAAQPLYMAVSNASGGPAVVAYDDPAATQFNTWVEWRVPLQAFADQGINLGNVDKIAIGLGSKSGMASAGGTGTMYFDDIRLYRP